MRDLKISVHDWSASELLLALRARACAAINKNCHFNFNVFVYVQHAVLIILLILTKKGDRQIHLEASRTILNDIAFLDVSKLHAVHTLIP